MKTSQELNLEISKKEILSNIPRCLDKLHVDSSINMELDEINQYIDDWKIDFPKLKSKWILIENKLYFIFNVQMDWQFLDSYWLECCDGNNIKKASIKNLKNKSCYNFIK